MANRLLTDGNTSSFEQLQSELKTGEVLVATWLRDPGMMSRVRVVDSAAIFDELSQKAYYGYYAKLRFYASDSPASENYHEYGASNARTTPR